MCCLSINPNQRRKDINSNTSQAKLCILVGVIFVNNYGLVLNIHTSSEVVHICYKSTPKIIICLSRSGYSLSSYIYSFRWYNYLYLYKDVRNKTYMIDYWYIKEFTIRIYISNRLYRRLDSVTVLIGKGFSICHS